MVNDDKVRKRLPPYVSYRTFHNFIDGLEQRVPARIDRSYWGDLLSGSTGTQLMAALRFLGLIDGNGRPTERLKPLVAAKGDQKVKLTKEITTQAYFFVLASSFDLQSGTYAQLEETFHDQFQLTGDVSRKCIKFFIALANDAGISLSPFITKHFRAIDTSTRTGARTKRTGNRTNRHLIMPQTLEEIPERTSWDKMLLTKFPTFDPAWPDEVKLKWFAAFDELLKRGLVKGGK